MKPALVGVHLQAAHVVLPQHREQPVRDTVLAYIDALTRLGHALMAGLALGLGLPERWFAEVGGTADPLILLRLFNYPSRPVPPGSQALWGVGEHTDYGDYVTAKVGKVFPELRQKVAR